MTSLLRFRTLTLLAVTTTSLLLVSCASQRTQLTSSLGNYLTIPENKDYFRKRWYAGAGFGGASLDPDLSATGFSVQSGNTAATRFTAGYDLHNLLSVEFDSSVLGSAELEATAEVEYTSFTASGLIYGLTSNANRSRRQSWSGFARLGYGLSSAASNVRVLDGRDLSGAVLGLGVEYGFRNGLGVRLEATRFHDEAVFTGIGAVFRFGKETSIAPRLGAAKPAETGTAATAYTTNNGSAVHTVRAANEPPLQAGLPGVFQQNAHPSHASNVTPRVSEGLANQYKSKVVIATAHDIDGDGVGNEQDECFDTSPGTSVDATGCGLFDGVVEGITFRNGSARLDQSSKQILDRLAVRLLAFPEVRVEVQAHTDNKGAETINQSVSETRARFVADYLKRQGVPAEQLVPVAVGETRPRADNDTELGRLSNRRIELKSLPDREIVPRHLTVVPPAAEVYLLNSAAVVKKPAKESGVPLQSAKGKGDSDTRSPEVTDDFVEEEPDLLAAKAKQAIALPPQVAMPGTQLNSILDNVEFEGRTADLKPSSNKALDRIAAQLTRFRSARVAIMAHTDDKGTADENQKLSLMQAQAVRDYLIERGIDKGRMTPQGYGDSLPVAQNLTEKDRELNSRVELRVVSR